ncbi:MAG: alpha/beta fold hydrolase [Candidatus Omnitrophota bacterium]
MTLSEMILMAMPLVWFLWSLFILKPAGTLKFILGWAVLLTGCLALSFFMNQNLSKVMGGQWAWSDALYYGWQLFSFVTILQIIKKVFELALRRMIRWPLNESVRKVLTGCVLYSVLIIIIIPFFLGMTSIHRVKIGDVVNPETALAIAYDDVSLKTRDGLNIKGWFVPADSDKAVIIAHGLGANKSNFLGTVDMWHQLNVNVLIFDFRGHGMSDGHTVTFGYRERLDVMAGLNYLIETKKFTADKIIGYGVSFGGAAMIHAANEMRVFHKIIIDSSFASLDDMADTIVAGEAIIPVFGRKFFKEIGLFFIRMAVGFDIREHSPENIVGRLDGTPLLLIHGKGDPLIHWKQTQRLYEKAGNPKQVVFLETQGHFGTMNDASYVEIIRGFVAN